MSELCRESGQFRRGETGVGAVALTDVEAAHADEGDVGTTMVDLGSVPLSALTDPGYAPMLDELAAGQPDTGPLITAGGHNS